jgi:V-type H+-transporting ATPase subunit E
MIKLLEPELLLKCRKEDLQLVQSLIPECEAEFKEIMDRETKESEVEYATKLRVIDTDFLTLEEGGECGGVILYNLNRKIVCPNTLKSRLDLCFEELLPHIRRMLFPKRQP